MESIKMKRASNSTRMQNNHGLLGINIHSKSKLAVVEE